MSECVTWCSIRLRGAACRLIVPPESQYEKLADSPAASSSSPQTGLRSRARTPSLAEVGVGAGLTVFTNVDGRDSRIGYTTRPTQTWRSWKSALAETADPVDHAMSKFVRLRGGRRWSRVLVASVGPAACSQLPCSTG